MKAGVVVVTVLLSASMVMAGPLWGSGSIWSGMGSAMGLGSDEAPNTFHANITPEQAIQTALSHAGGCKAIEVDLDNDGGLVWEVDVITNDGTYEVTVDACDGSVLSSHRECSLAHMRAERALSDCAISIDQAMQTALACAGCGYKVDEAELRDHGESDSYYKVRMYTQDGSRTSVKVDVLTGEIV